MQHPYTGSCGYGKLDTGYSYRWEQPAASHRSAAQVHPASRVPRQLPGRVTSPCQNCCVIWKPSCSYDAVAAMPDVSPDYNSSCGRCYELK